MNNNCSVVLFLQYSPLGLDVDVIAYTETEIYVKRSGERHSWLYWIKTHLVTKIETEIPEEKFHNHSIPAKIIGRKGNIFTLQVVSLNEQVETEFAGKLIKIETKAELIPDLESLLRRLLKCLNKIRSITGDKCSAKETREELLYSSNLEMQKLLKVFEIASALLEREKLECIIENLIELKQAFSEKGAIPVSVPVELESLISEFRKQLKDVS